MAIRVLVADDQPVVRAGIETLLNLEADIDVVGTAGDGAQAVDRCRRLRPDVVVMDVRMPAVDGVAATREITKESLSWPSDNPVKILILTTYNVDAAVYAAVRAGASGFLLKDAVPDEIVGAVRAVAAGDGWLDPAVTRSLLREFAARPEPLTRTGAEFAELTAREREILILVGHGLSNAEMADRLFISEATVKTHFGRVLTKLGLRDRAQAIVAAYRNGLIPLDGP